MSARGFRQKLLRSGDRTYLQPIGRSALLSLRGVQQSDAYSNQYLCFPNLCVNAAAAPSLHHSILPVFNGNHRLGL
ncbi:MAG: hypothetical protein NTV22_06625 [bacterium]|nr:hypothetical protein [bacterium]